MTTTRFVLPALLAGLAVLAAPPQVVAQTGGPAQGVADPDRPSGVGTGVDDTIITARVRTLLANVNGLDHDKIEVETKNGIVRLTGPVSNQHAKDSALIGVRQISGVRDLQDEMVVEPAPKD